MAKEEEGKKDLLEIWAESDDDDLFLTPKEKIHRPLVGSESLNRPLGSED